MADAMKLVPVEPTEEMMACAEQASQMLEWQIRASWSAMLAASPPAREEAPGEGAGERLLSEAAEKFRYYEASHRAKNTDEATAKAEVNAEISGRIEAFLRTRTSEPAREACYDCSTDRPHTTTESCNPAPATADKLRVAVGLLNDCIWLDTDTGDYRVEHDGSVEKARAILATLNEEG